MDKLQIIIQQTINQCKSRKKPERQWAWGFIAVIFLPPTVHKSSIEFPKAAFDGTKYFPRSEALHWTASWRTSRDEPPKMKKYPLSLDLLGCCIPSRNILFTRNSIRIPCDTGPDHAEQHDLHREKIFVVVDHILRRFLLNMHRLFLKGEINYFSHLPSY